jgi:hypothetical protein
VILKELMQFDFIMEIGMPLEYSYKMKSLVLFLKPKNERLSNTIEKVFKKCKLRYPHVILAVILDNEHPSLAAEKKLNELETNNSAQEGRKIATISQKEKNMCRLELAEEERREMEELCNITLLLLLKIGMIFLLLYNIFDLEYLIFGK